MQLKRVFGVGLAIALMAPIGVLSAQPAGAAGGTSCAKVGGKITLTPGLGTTPKAQTITFSLPLTGCKGGGVTGGTSKGTTHAAPGTCKSFGSGTQTMKITTNIIWNTKKTSTMTGTTSTKGVTTTIVGKITKGLFLGKKVTTTVTATLDSTSGGCTDSNPLKKLNVKNTKPFVIS
jgi:hypothetical protein